MWRETEPAIPVYRLTVAASSIFSKTVRGTPACGKTRKRVPVFTKPHDGISTLMPDMAHSMRSSAGAVAGRATAAIGGIVLSFVRARWMRAGVARRRRRSGPGPRPSRPRARRWVTGNERAISARASAIEASSPAAIACTHRLPDAVASTGPARTGSPVALAVSRQRSRLFDPPPTTWMASMGWPEARASSSTATA